MHWVSLYRRKATKTQIWYRSVERRPRKLFRIQRRLLNGKRTVAKITGDDAVGVRGGSGGGIVLVIGTGNERRSGDIADIVTIVIAIIAAIDADRGRGLSRGRGNIGDALGRGVGTGGDTMMTTSTGDTDTRIVVTTLNDERGIQTVVGVERQLWPGVLRALSPGACHCLCCLG